MNKITINEIVQKTFDDMNAYIDWAPTGEEEAKERLKKAISQLLDSIPCEERERAVIAGTYARGFEEGWNNKCQEIKQWIESVKK